MSRSIFATFSLLFCYLCSFAQLKEIEITNFFRRTVPPGKVWFISNTLPHRMMLKDGVFESGTACNSAVHSNPPFLYGIACFDSAKQVTHSPKNYGFTFRQQPEWLHDNVYSIQPYFLIKDEPSESVLKYSIVWKYSKDEIIFYPGMSLQMTGCISNLMIFERDMSSEDRKTFSVKQNAADKEQLRLSQESSGRKTVQAQALKAKFNDRSSVYSLDGINNRDKMFKNEGYNAICFKM